MATLIHLNGAPGIGKSTIARQYADAHPGVLCLDIDVLRTLVGGWEDDFAATGELVRPAALAMLRAYLATGHDVVLPQLLVRETELDRFRRSAVDGGATFVHVLLDAPPQRSVERLYARSGTDPLNTAIRSVVDEAGGPEAIRDLHVRLVGLASVVPDTRVVAAGGSLDDTYRAVLAAL